MAQSLRGMNCRTKAKEKTPTSYASQGMLGSNRRTEPLNKTRSKEARTHERPRTENPHRTLRRIRFRVLFMLFTMKITVFDLFKWRG